MCLTNNASRRNVSPLELIQPRPGGSRNAKGQTVKTTEQTPAVQNLISAAAQAGEQFTDDELEQFAALMRRDLLPLCFAVPGEGNIIDSVDPKTRRGHYSGEQLAEVRVRYPGAVLMPLHEWIAAKSAQQDTPGVWSPIEEDRFQEMLNVLPPAAWHGGAFLVGEATDHHAASGRPRFTCYRERGEEFAEYSRPMTHKEFVAEFGACPCYYNN